MKRIQKFSVTVRQRATNSTIVVNPLGGDKSSFYGELNNNEILPLKKKDVDKQGYAKAGIYKITVTPDKKGDWQIKRDNYGHVRIAKLFQCEKTLVCEPAVNAILKTIKNAGQPKDYLDFGQAFRCKIVVNKIKIPKKKRGL